MEAERTLFRVSRPIFFIGMMGCGKTTTGKQLAALLGWPFSDLDQFIEERHGCDIRGLFKKAGEAQFRELERDALRSVLDLPMPRVIACGGGTPCFFDNLDRMKEAGWVIYLETPVSLLASRLSGAEDLRPLLSGIDISTALTSIISRRAPFYEQAHIVFQQKNEGMKVAEELFRQFIQIEGH